jgi:hypothetical protein
MRTKKNLNRTATFEKIEDRSLLSVSAFLSGTKLEIIGTAASESVQVYQSGTSWKVQGIAGTKVNGSTAPRTFNGVTDIVAALGAGKDYLNIFKGTLIGGLTVIYQPGDTGFKTTVLSNLKVGSLQVANQTDSANSIAASYIQTTDGGADFATGAGNDAIALVFLKIAGTLQITAGDGNNVISVANIQTTGSGTDLIESGNGKDSIAVSQYSSTTNSLDIMSGAGTDAVALSNVNLGPDILFIDVGPGNGDVLTVFHSTAGLTEFLDTGGQNGFLAGTGNSFGTTDIDPNFTHRSGQFA